MSEKMNVGYIGLGNIGKPSARHLIGDAYTAHVYDIAPEPVAELVAAGAVGCDSVRQLAQCCKHIGVCVLNEAQVESLLYGEEGILENAAEGTVIAIHATVTRDAILKWSEDASAQGIHLIDAGISGGASGAEQGRLVYMVGGDAEIVERAKPVFMTSADNVIHAGPVGCGIILKLCNNLMQYLEFMAMSEATRLAEACGLTADMLRDVGLTNGVVNANMHQFVTGRDAVAASGREEDLEAFFGGFARIGEKDLDAALACAEQLGVKLPTTVYLRERISDMFYARDGQ